MSADAPATPPLSQAQAQGQAQAQAPTQAPASLDPITLALDGNRLIEASAGTGKTFTIALLYVRLVLGPRDDDDPLAFARALMPPEILVVTFTNAATLELRDRIRSRLVEAAEAFQNGAEGDPDDPLIRLRNEWPAARWPVCGRRLQLAAEWMDEAAISTIHAWCHRMLGEHAFDSGSLFSLTLETDQSELELEVARDYWRSFLYQLDPERLGQVTRYWDTPQALHKALRGLRAHADRLPPAPPPAESLAAVEAEVAERLETLKAPFQAGLDELAQALEDAAARKAFAGQKFNARSRATWLGALRDWAADPGQESPALTDAAYKRLSPDGLAEIWKDGAPPCSPVLEAMASLREDLATLPSAYTVLVRHGVHWMRERLEQAQLRRAEIGPDDLLTHLDRALSQDQGERLASRIRRQFPVAMIDEFQDTDPIQYRLFDRVYRLSRESRGDQDAPTQDETGAPSEGPSAVLLIGDPKQAIYAFRGADIYTYLRARRDTAGRHVTLATNFRSSQAMVAAVNRCFGQAEALPEGAFLFRQGDDNPLPFTAVAAKGRGQTLTDDGRPLPALCLWQLGDDAPLSKLAYREQMAERCATHMVALLTGAREGRIGFTQGAQTTPLGPGDLAVLVESGVEARAIRQALAQRGVKSVYLSDKDGVFETPAAVEVETWLRAVAHPDDGAALRGALATPSLALSLEELDALGGAEGGDDLAWERRVLQFRDYRRLWQRQGVLPMLRRLMHDFQVPARLLAGAQQGGDGERHLTDLLHLGELLQLASQELDGEHALIRHLAETRQEGPTQDDRHRLHLESDADLVQVVTIHKSKGLEYPLVFLPFIASHRATKAGDVPLWWQDGDVRRLALEADADIVERADRERLAEDLRKLYVALTRARHATWVGLAPLENLERSAIGYLLSGGAPLGPEGLASAIAAMADGQAAIDACPAPLPNPQCLPPAPRTSALAPARRALRSPREHWWIASYSALTLGPMRQPSTTRQQALAFSTDGQDDDAARASGAGTPQGHGDGGEQSGTGGAAPASREPTSAQEATARELRQEPSDGATRPLQTGQGGALHRFPRGPAAGTFLHGLLEWAGEQGFGEASDPERLDDMLKARTRLRGWGGWVPELSRWLTALMTTPLPVPQPLPRPLPETATGHAEPGAAATLRLADLVGYRVELEFWLASRSVDARRLDDLVSTHLLPGHPRPSLQADSLNGMLKGYIDLVAEHDGRYYVLDWKSNHLGDGDEAYTESAMRDAVLAKRYDIQYALYLLALHRLLRARLPDYAPERHLGGALYVFLRGTEAASRGVHGDRPSPAFIDALDALFRGDPSPAETP